MFNKKNTENIKQTSINQNNKKDFSKVDNTPADIKELLAYFDTLEPIAKKTQETQISPKTITEVPKQDVYTTQITKEIPMFNEEIPKSNDKKYDKTETKKTKIETKKENVTIPKLSESKTNSSNTTKDSGLNIPMPNDFDFGMVSNASTKSDDLYIPSPQDFGLTPEFQNMNNQSTPPPKQEFKKDDDNKGFLKKIFTKDKKDTTQDIPFKDMSSYDFNDAQNLNQKSKEELSFEIPLLPDNFGAEDEKKQTKDKKTPKIEEKNNIFSQFTTLSIPSDKDITNQTKKDETKISADKKIIKKDNLELSFEEKIKAIDESIAEIKQEFDTSSKRLSDFEKEFNEVSERLGIKNKILKKPRKIVKKKIQKSRKK